MKYFLIELTTTAEKIEKGVYEYDDRISAEAAFHSKMGGAMKNENYLAEALIVVNETGEQICYEYFKRPVEPEE